MRPEWVEKDGTTKLPSAMMKSLHLDREGGFIWFKDAGGDWRASRTRGLGAALDTAKSIWRALPWWGWAAVAGVGYLQWQRMKGIEAGVEAESWYWGERPTTTALTSTNIGQALDAPVRSESGDRAPTKLEQVIDQFKVASNPRYTPRDIGAGGTTTFCNIFVADVMRALGIDLPLGNANALVGYLKSWSAIIHGWGHVSQEEAVNAASQGYPTVAAWANPNYPAPGHVAVLRPGPAGVVTIANAGGQVFNKGLLENGFGKYAPEVSFFTHA